MCFRLLHSVLTSLFAVFGGMYQGYWLRSSFAMGGHLCVCGCVCGFVVPVARTSRFHSTFGFVFGVGCSTHLSAILSIASCRGRGKPAVAPKGGKPTSEECSGNTTNRKPTMSPKPRLQVQTCCCCWQWSSAQRKMSVRNFGSQPSLLQLLSGACSTSFHVSSSLLSTSILRC